MSIENDNLREALETIEFVLTTPLNSKLGATTTYTVQILDDDSIQNGGDLVISEIMYDLPGIDNEALEFVELYNRGTGAIDVTGYFFSSGIDAKINSNTVAAGGYYVLSADSAEFVSNYGFSPNQRWKFGDNIDDDGARIELRDPSGNLIDRINFKDNAPWPTNPVAVGASIALCDPTQDNSLAASWAKAFVPVNGLFVEGIQIRAHPNGACDPVVAFVINEIGVLESDNKQFVFQANLFNPNGTASSVDVTIDALATSAVSGQDYNFAVQTLDFPAGTDTVDFAIDILDDQDVDQDDTITLVFSNPVNAAVLGQMLIRIVDNESTGLGNGVSLEEPLALYPNPSHGQFVRLNKRHQFHQSLCSRYKYCETVLAPSTEQMP